MKRTAGDTMVYRQADPRDIEPLMRMFAELVLCVQRETGDAYWDFETPDLDGQRRRLETVLRGGEERIFVAEEGDRLTGFLQARIEACHLPLSPVKQVGYIAAAYVLPECRGRHVLRRLEGIALEYFRSCGLRYAELHCLTANAMANRAWGKLGYQTFREHKRKKID